MRTSRTSRILLGAALVVLVWGTALAEDTRHKWQIGFGLSYFSTEDDIRSDADLAGCSGVFPDLTCTDIDPRLDRNILNEATIGDNFRFDFSASYGFTRFFAVEFQGSYFQGEVGKLETFRQYQTFNSFTGQINEQIFQENRLIPAADITQIPLQLSGLIRFRPESPFAPYVGGGIGYIFTELNNSAEFDALNAQINALQVSDVDPPFGADGIIAFDPDPGLPESLQETPSQAAIGVEMNPVQITVGNGYSFHVRGGFDYFFTRSFSLYVDGTYTWTDPSLQIRVNNQPAGQVTLNKVFTAGADGFYGPRVLGASLVNPGPDGIYGTSDDDRSEFLSRYQAGTCGINAKGDFVCQSEFLDACRDSAFSGVRPGLANTQLPECRGEDLNNNFVLDPGEDVNNDGYLSRTYGICVQDCTCSPMADINCNPMWVNSPGDTHEVLTFECIGGDPDPARGGDPRCPALKDTNNNGMIDAGDDGYGVAPSYEYIHYTGTKFTTSGQQIVPFAVSRADDVSAINNFIIQGGDIDLEGFSLGVGVKFTF